MKNLIQQQIESILKFLKNYNGELDEHGIVRTQLRHIIKAQQSSLIDRVIEEIGEDEELELIERTKDYEVYKGYSADIRARNELRNELRAQIRARFKEALKI